jgi:hypothetical protein
VQDPLAKRVPDEPARMSAEVTALALAGADISGGFATDLCAPDLIAADPTLKSGRATSSPSVERAGVAAEGA